MSFKKAKREQIQLKVLLGGIAGSGKTMGALRLATGIVKKTGGRIAFIDTENGRCKYYADKYDFDSMQLEPPFTPEKFTNAINDAIDNEYSVVIIDSFSAAWDEILNIHSRMSGNSYTNWAKLTPRTKALNDSILQSPIHVITCCRAKDDVVLEDVDGKKVPRKVGMALIARAGTEFDYTVSLMISQSDHRFDVSKDNSELFSNRYDILCEKDGEALWNWANNGDIPTPKEPQETANTDEISSEDAATLEDISVDVSIMTTDEIKEAITKVATSLNPTNKKLFSVEIKTLLGMSNYNKCDDLDLLQQLYGIAESFKE